jgi:uncharacterized protein YqgC (DUF456 family)
MVNKHNSKKPWVIKRVEILRYMNVDMVERSWGCVYVGNTRWVLRGDLLGVGWGWM